MKVLYLVGTLNAGGLERFVTRVCLQAKQDKLFEPAVFCLLKREGQFLVDLEKAHIIVSEAPPNWQRSLRQNIQLRKLIRDLSPDIIHSQVNFSMLQQWFAIVGLQKPRFFITERSCYTRQGWSKIRRVVQFYWLKLFHVGYSANGNEVAQHVARITGVRPETIPVIPNGVSIPATSLECREHLRDRFGYQDTDIVIGSVARVIEAKGPFKLLKAVKLLIEKGYVVKLLFVGDGPDRGRLERQVTELGLKNHVVITGTVPDVEAYLEAIDIFVLLSEREGMPNAVLEAMASGKPIVAANVGSITELLDGGKNGILLPDTNPEKAAAAMIDLIVNPLERESYGKRAREYVKVNYSIDQVMRNLMKLYAQ